jgi:hypothetical protein
MSSSDLTALINKELPTNHGRVASLYGLSLRIDEINVEFWSRHIIGRCEVSNFAQTQLDRRA